MCNICNSNITYIKTYENIFNFKNRTIKLVSLRRFCKNCHNLVSDKELDNSALLKAIDLYNNAYGIPKEKIIKLRRSYNLSQIEFSKIIGCAKKTLISYEKGTSIPNDNYEIIIKTLLKNPYIIYDLIEANQDNFSNQEYLKIHNKIKLNYN